MNGMKERYQKEVSPALMKALGIENVMQVPRIQKVVINIGLGEAMDNPKALDAAVIDLTLSQVKNRSLPKPERALRTSNFVKVVLLELLSHCAVKKCGHFWID